MAAGNGSRYLYPALASLAVAVIIAAGAALWSHQTSITETKGKVANVETAVIEIKADLREVKAALGAVQTTVGAGLAEVTKALNAQRYYPPQKAPGMRRAGR